MKKIYIAGYDVFFANAIDIGENYKKICEKYGYFGMFPTDNEIPENEITAEAIFKGDVALIDKCDIIVANLNSFRGHEIDSGTAFEIGYAYAKGKSVFGYMADTTPMREKIGEADEQGIPVEDFKMPVNLMIGVPATIVQGGFEDCIKIIKE